MTLPEVGSLVQFKKDLGLMDNTGDFNKMIFANTIGKIVKVDYPIPTYGDIVNCMITVAYGNNTSTDIQFVAVNWSIHQSNLRIFPDTAAARVLYEQK